MKTPDLTPAQLVSGLGAILSALVILFKLNLTGEQQAALLTVIGTLVPVAWQVSDAIVRHGRAGVVAAQHTQAAAEIAAASSSPDFRQTPPWAPVSGPATVQPQGFPPAATGSSGVTPQQAATVGQTPAS